MSFSWQEIRNIGVALGLGKDSIKNGCIPNEGIPVIIANIGGETVYAYPPSNQAPDNPRWRVTGDIKAVAAFIKALAAILPDGTYDVSLQQTYQKRGHSG